MKKGLINISMISVATAVVLSMTGCGGGSGGGSNANGATSTTTTGIAADGYIKNATICLGDGNSTCITNSPTALTDVNGSYTLNIPANILTKYHNHLNIIVKGGMDIDTDANLTGILKAPYTSSATTNITPLTTLVSAMVDKNASVKTATAYKQVAAALSLRPAQVKANPVKLSQDGNTTLIQKAMTIHRVITTMAKAAGVNNSKIYGDLVTAIKTVADSNTPNKSIVAIVTTAADETNSTLPSKAQKAARAASIVETFVKKAIAKYPKNMKNAALVSDDVVNSIQTGLDKNDSNTTIKSNASTTLANAHPIKIAVKNILQSYLPGTTISDANITTIANNFTTSSDVSVEKIIASSSINSTIKSDLQKAYTAQQIKLYVEKNGQTVSSSEVAQIAAIPGIDYTTLKTMSLADFSKKLYATGEADLMSLSLKLSPPPGIASMSDIQKAKDLFSSVRTQVNGAETFAKGQSTKINTALNNVANSATFTTAAVNTFEHMIVEAIDTNQTTVSRLEDSGDRNVTVSKVTKTNNVTWKYTVKDKNPSATWTGSLTYTNVNPKTFNPSNFKTLTAKLNGTMPIDYYGAKIPSTDTNSQSVDAKIVITKTANGAKAQLDASFTSNGNSVNIKNANLSVAYDVNGTTKEPLVKYVELQNLSVNGTVGDYTLDGQLNIPSYVINKIDEAKGFDLKTTYYWFGFNTQCDNNSTLNVSNVKYDGIASDNTGTSNGTTTTFYWFNWDNMTSEPKEINATSNYTGLTCSDNSKPAITSIWQGSWTDDNIQNSGRYPSAITFDGKLTNNKTGAYLNANIDAKWTNIADINLSNGSYLRNLNLIVAVSGTLQMPSSAVPMKVNLNYANQGVKTNIKVTYINGDTSVTADSFIPNILDNNATVNLSSSTGIKAKIVIDSGKVNYKASTLTNTSGKTVGYFVDRAGVPFVKYPDGTLDSLY